MPQIGVIDDFWFHHALLSILAFVGGFALASVQWRKQLIEEILHQWGYRYTALTYLGHTIGS